MVKSVPSRPTVQVDASHYLFGNYLGAERWASYYHQIHAVLASGARSVLYVGVGDNLVPTALELQDMQVSRFDFDPDLGADFVGDLGDIGGLVPPKSHDVVVCCQVLEHLPFEKFEGIIQALCGIARQRLVISLPYRHKRLVEATIELPVVGRFPVAAWIPAFWRKWQFNGEHHWELGTRGYQKSRVIRLIRRHGQVRETYHVPGNRYHFFIIVDTASRERKDE